MLANDSVYGPLFDLKEILARCDASADIWGMTDNRAGGYHLQSYFLLFRGRALVCPEADGVLSVRATGAVQGVGDPKIRNRTDTGDATGRAAMCGVVPV